MNVIGYVRVSTRGQVKDGYSLAYQKDEIQRHCREQGWTLVDIRHDAGISGAKVDENTWEVEREGLRDTLDVLSTGQACCVVVLNTNRLWRSDIVKVLIHRELKKYGADVKSVEQPNYSIYKRDPSDVLINGMMELLDEYQRLEIALKLGRGRRKKAAQGGYAGGRAAFGYRAKRGQKLIEVHPDEALIVKRLFALRKRHSDWSLSRLADKLNHDGFCTRQGAAFTKVQVKRILDRKEFYEGTYFYSDVKAQGKHQPIIGLDN
ncbi:recombinase family protein [Alicyclobacillus ferrooxydans]|uniref:Resolvase n=1 Tax=Alicyclobacillus ferrooxydans TaxID=471514 RepID=A0A0P9CNS2_9BACL|nr:recombinase family protein [Alicyclobacillus ferrooxydans]KPV44516.1 resolvase [Alicyclobacillus ferrooxydans]